MIENAFLVALFLPGLCSASVHLPPQNGAPYSALDWKGNRNNVCAIDIYRWHSMLLDVATVGLNALEPLYHHVRPNAAANVYEMYSCVYDQF